MVCREVFDLPGFVAQVEALDDQVPTQAQTALYLEFRRLLDRSVRWFLQNRPATLDIGAEVARFAPVVAELAPRMPELPVGAEAKALADQSAELEALGIPQRPGGPGARC